MGVGKQHAAGGEPIKIRSVNALSAAHTVDPVIQVINGDEQHVGPAWRLGAGGSDTREQQGES